MEHRPQTRGFTLIELLIVLAIIGVLSAIAVPQFQDASRRSHRAEAQQIVLDIATRQGMYLLDAHAYTSSLTSLGITAPKGWTCTAATCTNPRYSIAVAVVTTPPTFTVTATATGTQVADGNLTLNDAGVKTRMVGGVDNGW